ncbi:MAG TPA: cytochrome c-type biogenesis protein CcmH [Acidimicrobiales bacterium]|nr:cytochrome c-type biogenesis protein CcmH [Acidimicrobiales bacterium]
MSDALALGTLLRSRSMWAALVVVFVVLLAIGSAHTSVTTRAQRIANLENVLKCPSCADASLAQSETVAANELKSTIRDWVGQGLSDQSIEARMVATYGQGELLRPTESVLWIVPAVAVSAAVAGLLLFFARRRPPERGVSKEGEARVLELLGRRADSRRREVDDDG